MERNRKRYMIEKKKIKDSMKNESLLKIKLNQIPKVYESKILVDKIIKKREQTETI